MRTRGFTLFELLFVVAVVGVLAAIALPTFFGVAPRARVRAEVATTFADLRIRLDQYLAENGRHISGRDEDHGWPTAPGPILPLPIDTWGARGLHVRLSNTADVECTYGWVTSTDGEPGAIARAVGYVPPGGAWYYVYARCAVDQADRYYLTDSADTTIRSAP